MPKLIKDFRDYQFVYYWYEKGTGKLSPYLPTLTHAEEWIEQHRSTQFNGVDRRGRDQSSIYQRRASDRILRVDVDISVQKIADLKQSFAA
ncbi:hypothetical protein ACMXYV_16210 [Neptuniibacter sp. SY11_33]|uniref:hypothetical protein n=1 Tax=Neptuniibacter sp. SY11_33 TaxID=3398215 RepID=UPI0039F5DE94